MTPVNYDFSKDLPIAIKTEEEVAAKFEEFYGHTVVRHDRTNKYDMLVKTAKKGKEFSVEVKEDFTCEETGNVGLEFHCRGKPSGIDVTQATHYVYKLHTKQGIRFYIIKTDKLKKMIVDRKYKRIVIGGDKDSGSMNYLFGLDVFVSQATEIFRR